MPRTKKGKALDKKRNHAAATNMLSRNAKRQAQSAGHSAPPHLTMKEEARNTGGRNLWRPGSLLRHQAVQFVSAGELQPADHEPPPQIPTSIEPPPAVTKRETSTAIPEMDSNTADDSVPFFVDSIGGTIPQTGMPDPITNIASDESSEDEIVFHGRQNCNGPNIRVLDERTIIHIHAHNTRQRNNQDTSKRPPTSSVKMPVKDLPAASGSRPQVSDTESKSTSDVSGHQDTEKKQTEKHYADNIFDGEFDVLSDYLLNIDHEYYHKGTTKQESTSKTATQNAEYHHHAEDGCVQITGEYSKQASDPEDEEIIGTPETSTPRSTSLFNHDMENQPSESEDSGLDPDLGELGVLEELSIQDREQRDLNRPGQTKHKRNKFPPASAFADALELDPYYGFDIMDFDRPSLRKKSKARRHAPDLELSDTELEIELTRAWQNDREKKKSKKQRREDLRSRGLLGRDPENPDLRAKYGNGMSPEELRTEIHAFFLSPRNSLPLPAMPKHRRKLIHDLASSLSLNSKSRGKGASRFPILHKTSRTPEYSTKTVSQINKILSAGSFKSKNGTKTPNNRRGQLGGSVSYMDGDVVGASAPEIGVENKGRAMLEKMGWSTGTALGATNNKGILLPVTHVVKNSKAGLG